MADNVTNLADRRYRLTVKPKPRINFPDLWASAYISGPKIEVMPFIPMLARARIDKAQSVEEADFVIFAGGADVDPQLYGQTPHHKTYFNAKRDEEEMDIYQQCLDQGIPMMGVCRGAQFGWVMRGGSLYQDVNNHHGAHSMTDIVNGVILNNVSSVHHQMCKAFPASADNVKDLTIIGVTRRSSTRYFNHTMFETDDNNEDIEAYFFRDNCFLGFQGHPEYSGYDMYTEWCLKQMRHYFAENPDIEVRDMKWRLKQSYNETLAARRAS